ncbi:hypothetical protein SK128_010158 [Halocaridina rubra]|uniref:Uncharacterized protein n=1 Tax=Halocaridina rubra TaxID=373956 RepID=A0AAN9A102_HALRR
MGDTRSVIARLEQLSREYNALSQYLTSQNTGESSYQGIDTHPQEQVRETDRNELETDIKKLSSHINKLTSEKHNLEKLSQERDNENTKAIGKLKQEIKDCMNDTELLKDVIKRLNEQLNRYHLKYGPIRGENYANIAADMNSSSIYKLGALLNAYDELINERDSALSANAEKYEKFMVRVDCITSENEKLLARLERLQKEVPIGSEEAELVAADARLLLDEREILLREVQALQQQKHQETSELQAEVSKLQHQLEESKIKNHSLQSDVISARQECSELERKCQALQKDLRNSVTREEHQLAVNECQRLFEELRLAYSQESGDLKGRVRAVKHEKKNLAEKLTDSSANVHHLNVQVSGLKGSLRKYESRVQRREQTLQSLETSYRLAKTRLRSLAQVSSELLEDRERLLESLSAQQKETDELLRDVTLRSASVGALSQKLKEERLSWSGRLAESEGGRLAAKSAWKRASKEAKHLRSLIATKDDTIASLIADYRILGLDINEAKRQHLKQYVSKS